ncbi:hypothetical protein D777_00502 [Marinobacter nitratireducens]|uniref:Uncharacterized protein n=1 Tax=Marinobacter nitratireducens TaxID=1137280 RepID=A0A072NIF0_9GAMM|nr:hypothetical protein [Marinobacter nitratireducens]KEF32940.1 hypothetical protein D777_00502 [Marinobacter nitratireducens]
MVEPQEVEGFSASAFRANGIGPLPESPRKRFRTGEELQPIGSYAETIPYLRTIQDVEALQDKEKEDPEFKDTEWWSDHQRIRFLNGKLGFRFLILLLPITWILVLVVGGMAVAGWGILAMAEYYSMPGLLVGIIGLILIPGWMLFALVIARPTTNWLMSTGIGFFVKPFEKNISKKVDDTLEDGCSEFNRVTGPVRMALGRGRYFEAPFVEFDAYVDRVIQQGGIFYRLILVHRYTQKSFHNTAFSSIESSKFEVLALWDVLQQYMDVSQPLPDTPRLEPFRHLDPVTAEHDKKTGRNPRYWRDLDLEAWKEGDGWKEVHRRQCEYPWEQRECKLTPKLGQIDMATYREQRPASASVI